MGVGVGAKREGGGADRKNKAEAFSRSVFPSAGVPIVCKTENLLLVIQNGENTYVKSSLSTWVVDEVIHTRKRSQAFSLRVCILLAIENWTSKKLAGEESQRESCQFAHRWQN